MFSLCCAIEVQTNKFFASSYLSSMNVKTPQYRQVCLLSKAWAADLVCVAWLALCSKGTCVSIIESVLLFDTCINCSELFHSKDVENIHLLLWMCNYLQCNIFLRQCFNVWRNSGCGEFSFSLLKTSRLLWPSHTDDVSLRSYFFSLQMC